MALQPEMDAPYPLCMLCVPLCNISNLYYTENHRGFHGAAQRSFIQKLNFSPYVPDLRSGKTW